MGDSEAWWSAVGTLPEVLRPGDLPKLNEGLRHLFKELREAQAAYVGDSRPDGVYFALVAINAFVSLFRAVGTEGLIAPLMELESALWALDEGVTEPLLKPVRRAKPGRAKPGRQRAAQLRQEFLGMVAYTVKKLCDFGCPQSEARKAVADDLNRVGMVTEPDRGSGQVTPRTVRDWCERVSEDFGRHSPAAQRYDALMADPRTAALGRMPAETAAHLLRRQLVRAAKLLGMAQRRRKTT
jgi:hypothetical protein